MSGAQKKENVELTKGSSPFPASQQVFSLLQAFAQREQLKQSLALLINLVSATHVVFRQDQTRCSPRKKARLLSAFFKAVAWTVDCLLLSVLWIFVSFLQYCSIF